MKGRVLVEICLGDKKVITNGDDVGAFPDLAAEGAVCKLRLHVSVAQS
jgi:hypothetical protein